VKKLFGTDGIRGTANKEPMTPETAFKIGRAGAYLFKDEFEPKIIIGRDTRISGDMIEAALIAGICSMGVNVFRAGIVPTPAVAYLTKFLQANCGIVISASHNPFEDNGIKYFKREGYKFSDKEEEEIEKIYFKNYTKDKRPTGKDIGKVEDLPKITEKYIGYLKNTLPNNLNLKDYKVVIDCANGASFIIAPQVLTELEAKVIVMNDKPNGININLNCGSTHPNNLREEVLKHQANLGFAYDGDADRVIAIDEKGNIVDGDEIMAICAVNLLQKNQLPNNTVVTTLMSNLGFTQTIEQAGGIVIRTNIGDRYVLETMKKVNAAIGGEQSGHIIYLEHSTTGDGLLTSLQLLRVLKEKEVPLSCLTSIMKKYPQINLNIKVSKKNEFYKCINIIKAIDKVEKELAGKGRILVRPSGTEPLIRILLEGEDKDTLVEFSENLKEVIVKEDI